MSGHQPGGPGTPVPTSAGNGPTSGNIALPPAPSQPSAGGSGVGSGGTGTAPGGSISQQNLNSIVIEYLSKKGYSRTEAMLRMESGAVDKDGRPLYPKVDEKGAEKYGKAFDLLRTWIDQNLDIYKPELKRILWPIFVYSFLSLAVDFYPNDCERFFTTYKDLFTNDHESDLRNLSTIRLAEHVQQNAVAQIYRTSKYRLPLTSVAYFNLIQFLESKEKEGGAVIIGLLQLHCHVVTVERGATDAHSLAAMLRKAQVEEDMPAEDEGIPGHNPGSANTNENAPAVLPKLKLGPPPMEPDLMGDVQAELEEEDVKHPPAPGQPSLVDEFQKIKREESEDAPSRHDLPFPPSLARDVAMEVQKVKENRDRFQMEGRTGGVGPGLSVTMFTFHNTYDSINCIDFSQDNMLVAAGTDESYIRVWSLDGKALPSIVAGGPTAAPPSASRRLIGHSGPVYAVSFSPSIAKDRKTPSVVPTGPRYLISCSADKTIRLWSVDAWACLVVYKGHDHPIWDVTWGPYGHYFLTGSHDKTARLWSTDHISYLRMFAGHDQDVDTVCFHPNSGYVFTGSSDKTVRMWSVTTGVAVRLFTGHTGNLTALSCSPDGKSLASADDAGAIILWELTSGRRLKRMRGHGKGGIWSLDWNVESTVLVSGGADGTVRVWDVMGPSEAQTGKIIGEGGAGTKIDAGNATTANGAGSGNASSTAGMANASGTGQGGQNSTSTANANVTSTTNPGGNAATSTATGGGTSTGNATTSGSSTATGTAGTGAGAAGAAGVGAKKKAKEMIVTADQISAFPTKKSPVYTVRVTRQNLVLAGGAFLP
ncbi:MAG: Transcription initiation factor TFIID subunit 5 [Thelocarpon superellum]|nr:MAG: Transcription initiation factor TFIID subunit 5 [Thelocarpon superellum]